MNPLQQAADLLRQADELIQRCRIPGDVMFEIHSMLEDTAEYLEEQLEDQRVDNQTN